VTKEPVGADEIGNVSGGIPMLNRRWLGLAVACGLLIAAPADANDDARIFFLHNSVGLGLIEQGGMRAHLAAHNTQNQIRIAFWDHNYPYIGLTDPAGDLTGYPYGSECGFNTDPDGLARQWLDLASHIAAARDSILTHDVIAFKSCYRACDFAGASTASQLAEALLQYKAYYLDMRAYFDQHPEKVFVVLSPPPRHRLHEEQSVLRAATARQFADWLDGPEFRGDPPRVNLKVFDLFDRLAAPDDASPAANMLRYEYERSHSATDSHPNAEANALIGPILMQTLIAAAGHAATAVEQPPDVAGLSLQVHPNPFNPSTTLRFELPRAAHVKLEIFDMRGRLVALVASGTMAGGWHEFTWSGRDQRGQSVGSGVWLCRLEADAAVVMKRLTLVK
jgi:hypothetical protein